MTCSGFEAPRMTLCKPATELTGEEEAMQEGEGGQGKGQERRKRARKERHVELTDTFGFDRHHARARCDTEQPSFSVAYLVRRSTVCKHEKESESVVLVASPLPILLSPSDCECQTASTHLHLPPALNRTHPLCQMPDVRVGRRRGQAGVFGNSFRVLARKQTSGEGRKDGGTVAVLKKKFSGSEEKKG